MTQTHILPPPNHCTHCISLLPSQPSPAQSSPVQPFLKSKIPFALNLAPPAQNPRSVPTAYLFCFFPIFISAVTLAPLGIDNVEKK